ncbi:MAG: sulfur transferase domain-containing protein [Flavobacteriaceae bacterium]|nr:sulfur transferase domain-containing protein [Flavobacteriaceae bacterium]
MKNYKIITILFLFLLASMNAQEKLDSIIKLNNDGFREILVQVNDVYISGQPEKHGLNKLKELGVTTVVNLRTNREMDDRNIVPYDEAIYIDSLGMKYIHIPLGGPENPYTPEALETFNEALNQSHGKVLLHCTVAWRASHLWTAYLIKYRNIDVDQAIEHGKKINLSSLPLESFLNRKITLKQN